MTIKGFDGFPGGFSHSFSEEPLAVHHRAPVRVPHCHASSQFIAPMAPLAVAALLRGPPLRCFPKPSLEQSAAPLGKGLTVAEEFGKNAVRTAGGYVIVADGVSCGWSIFGPGQKPTDTPMTRVEGDPHVYEKDGTRWDFTKTSCFKFGDGSIVRVKTTAEEGQSVSASLDIINGNEHVAFSGLDRGDVKMTAIDHNGYQLRAGLTASDTFLLGGDTEHVKWFRLRNGKLDGEVVSAALIEKDGKKFYEQTVEKANFVVDPGLRPKVGTPAWNSLLRSEAIDAARERFGAGSSSTQVAALKAEALDKNEREAPQRRLAQLARIERQLESMIRMFTFLYWARPARGHGIFVD